MSMTEREQWAKIHWQVARWYLEQGQPYLWRKMVTNLVNE